MGEIFRERIVDTGRVPLFAFFTAFIVVFLLTRMVVRLIRAHPRGPLRNVERGGLHIHHMVFGVVLMLVGGVAGIALPDARGWAPVAAAAVFGAGAALTLDEFALILHLSDVYWSEQGRQSVDAVLVAVAMTGLLLLGLHPVGAEGLGAGAAVSRSALVAGYAASLGFDLLLAVITLLKGKVWTGLIGLFLPVLLVVGALRVARPGSPWARRRYAPGSRRYLRAVRREERLRRPLVRAKIRVEELIAGRPGAPR
ncbi:MAG: hypothetical protein IRY90_11445 [Actinomadura rubrobrunea]|nr:hypothetical protein [Actinomadura rubrobrunea]